ncbi:MAG TPA: hypothetical protein VIS31_04870 [Woeseiaceae bacterium]
MVIVRPVMTVHPGAWLFFLPFIITTSFTVLILFIALMVNSTQSLQSQADDNVRAEAAVTRDEREMLARQNALLAEEVRSMRAALERR